VKSLVYSSIIRLSPNGGVTRKEKWEDVVCYQLSQCWNRPLGSVTVEKEDDGAGVCWTGLKKVVDVQKEVFLGH
jgi:hypothetical protein